MRFIVICFLLAVSSFATNLLTYNLYERSDRIDIMLSFDSTYDGNIFQKRDKDKTSLILNSLSYKDSIEKKINSNIFQELKIIPRESSIVLQLSSISPIVVSASKTKDGYGLRIRSRAKTSLKQSQTIPKASVSLATQKDELQENFIDKKYTIVLGVMIVLLIILFFIKKFISNKSTLSNSTFSQIPWLGKQNPIDVNVIYEKSLDKQNKVMLLNYENKKYLVLVGNSNLLLDSFGEEKIKNEDDFALFFEENKKKLGNFLQDRQTSLDSYKNRLNINEV